jgi:hypothetical protein
MVSITATENELFFDILGSHKFWLLKIRLKKIIKAYQTQNEFTFGLVGKYLELKCLG